MSKEEMNSKTTNENSISFENNTIKYTISTPVDEEEAKRLNGIGSEYIDKKGGIIYILIDLKKSTQFSSGARKEWVKFLQNPKINKVAIFGGNVFVRTLASFVIAASKSKNIKFFTTEEEATSWFAD